MLCVSRLEKRLPRPTLAFLLQMPFGPPALPAKVNPAHVLAWPENLKEISTMNHVISSEPFKANDGNMSTITPVCSCGWRGFGVAAYNDDQLTQVRKQGDTHIRVVTQTAVTNVT